MRVIVYSAKYIVIPSFFSIYEVPEELKILLTKDPEMLYSFGHGCLSLLKKEEETKRNLADRDAKAFADFSDIGRIFQIRYP